MLLLALNLLQIIILKCGSILKLSGKCQEVRHGSLLSWGQLKYLFLLARIVSVGILCKPERISFTPRYNLQAMSNLSQLHVTSIVRIPKTMTSIRGF